MRVISTHPGLRLASGLIFLSVPLIALETLIVHRAPWWRLPVRPVLYWSLAMALICAPIVWWILSGKKWAYQVLVSFASLWFTLSALTAIAMKRPALGFFSLCLMLFLGPLVFWIRREMSRTFFDPELEWYQEIPKAIPGLICQINSSEQTPIELKVSRIDHEGVFLFSETPFEGFPKKQKAEFVFKFRDRKVAGSGVPMVVLERGSGVGIQFDGMSPDSRKELGDFVEKLRGEGYVQH